MWSNIRSVRRNNNCRCFKSIGMNVGIDRSNEPRLFSAHLATSYHITAYYRVTHTFRQSRQNIGKHGLGQDDGSFGTQERNETGFALARYGALGDHHNTSSRCCIGTWRSVVTGSVGGRGSTTRRRRYR
jgi:hypothetical protein